MMKKDILNYLSFLKNNDLYLYANYQKLSLLFKILISSNEIQEILDTLINTKSESIDKFNKEDILNITTFFFNQIDENISNIFQENYKAGKILYDKNVDKAQFITKRNINTLELEDYQIQIPEKNDIEDYYTIVHENTHFSINKINENKTIDKSVINIYDETIAIYSELVFYNYSKKILPENSSSKIINERILTAFSQGQEIYDSYLAIRMILSDCTYEQLINKFGEQFIENFEYNIINKKIYTYEHFIGTINALNLYANNISLKELFFLANQNMEKLEEKINLKLNPNEIIATIKDLKKNINKTK